MPHSPPFSRRKLTAYDRRCLKAGKVLLRTEEGLIHCGTRSKFTKKEAKNAKILLENASIERLREFAKIKSFDDYSTMDRRQLINAIYNYTDPKTGDVIYRTSINDRSTSRKNYKRSKSRKLTKRSKSSKNSKRSKNFKLSKRSKSIKTSRRSKSHKRK